MHDSTSIDAVGIAWRLGATLLLVFVNGFFVAAEFALVTVKRASVVELADEGRFTARAARHILDRLDRYLAACQLGITVASLVLGALGEPAVAAAIHGILNVLDIPVSPTNPVLHWSALVFGFAIITVLHMTLGEQAPKMWALRHAQPAALAVALPLRIFTVMFAPLIGFINGLSNAILRSVGMEPGHGHEGILTLTELRRSLTLSAHAGHISERGREIAENVLRLSELQVRHILVPRPSVVQLSTREPLSAALDAMDRSGHSRYPLCDGDLDNVVGIIHTRDVFRGKGPPASLEAFVRCARPPLLVPNTAPLADLIAKLQKSGSHVAVVLDEFGSALGLAFLEDALEEIVGPIVDEFDEAVDLIVETEPGVFDLAGTLPIPDVADRFGLDIESATESTLGGYVTSQLERLPRKGDEVRVGDFVLRVTGVVRGKAVGRIRLSHAPASPPTSPDA